MCYDKSYIDFSQFNSALIIGKLENSDLFSNGVGKTTIFKAIEYVLFNQSDFNLENIIRDDTNQCRIVLDFSIKNKEYRLSRTRTKKGVTDLILLERISDTGSDYEVYHNENCVPYFDKNHVEKHWKDLSASRAGDTEKDLAKLIKINYKSFKSTVHFVQNDFTGLPTATPEKRKAILKDALNLLIYSKLEKIAKDEFTQLSKEYEKNKLSIDVLGTPNNDIIVLKNNLENTSQLIEEKNTEILNVKENQSFINSAMHVLISESKNLESKFSEVLIKKNENISAIDKLKKSITEYLDKKNNIVKISKEIIEEISKLKKERDNLIKNDFSEIDIMSNNISSLKEELGQNNLTIKNCLQELAELKSPLPKGDFCESCKQNISQTHIEECRNKNASDTLMYQNKLKDTKIKIEEINNSIIKNQKTLTSLNELKLNLVKIENLIKIKDQEIIDKKSLYTEYVKFHQDFSNELVVRENNLIQIETELNNSSIQEVNLLKDKIKEKEKELFDINIILLSLNKELTHFNNQKAIINHSLNQKYKDLSKKIVLEKNLQEIEEKIEMYPSVIKAFSSTGIPNLMIQNMLDDFQIESNILLNQLKPGLQISFFVAKTKDDGSEADTLDIKYHLNGKPRYYEQLSGAMKLAIIFSLKLGLSFVLQKMMGIDVQFLLLDEIDQSLDKASIDTFAEIVKFFQNDFTILIITHNDRLKDKFSNIILVEQDKNMISRAKVLS